MRIKNKIYYSVAISSSLPLAVFGASSVGVDLTIDSLFAIITGLACWLTEIASILMVIFIVFYGIQMFLAQDDATKFGNAKKSFYYALLGIMVILGTYVIIATVANAVGANTYSLIPLSC